MTISKVTKRRIKRTWVLDICVLKSFDKVFSIGNKRNIKNINNTTVIAVFVKLNITLFLLYIQKYRFEQILKIRIEKILSF